MNDLTKYKLWTPPEKSEIFDPSFKIFDRVGASYEIIAYIKESIYPLQTKSGGLGFTTELYIPTPNPEPKRLTERQCLDLCISKGWIVVYPDGRESSANFIHAKEKENQMPAGFMIRKPFTIELLTPTTDLLPEGAQ